MTSPLQSSAWPCFLKVKVRQPLCCEGRCDPTNDQWSRQSIRAISQYVVVTRMTGSFFKEMHENPTQIYRNFATDVVTYFIEAGSSRNDSVDLSPDLLVSSNSQIGTTYNRVLPRSTFVYPCHLA